MKWEKGRQGTGYETLTLWRKWFFDVVLIRYRVGTGVPYHYDPISDFYEHHRFNFVVRYADEGGAFLYNYDEADLRIPWRWWRLIIFRPDLIGHVVTPVIRGERWVFSVGWRKKK